MHAKSLYKRAYKIQKIVDYVLNKGGKISIVRDDSENNLAAITRY
ncbi:MAG: hypothetical protein Q9M91_02710 [Candidatus Dojkabacteria bacterium]|nr:hypothetical protein [Candidatus Dojkabacteria bacterium]MDQ7020736.1 hypothetical protein [Candidatus Dojkabacteria bacterium]